MRTFPKFERKITSIGKIEIKLQAVGLRTKEIIHQMIRKKPG
jgi:hypothetical protein